MHSKGEQPTQERTSTGNWTGIWPWMDAGNPSRTQTKPPEIAVGPAEDGLQEERLEHAGRDLGLYVISVASKMLNMHPQTLRKYERMGLITPSRTVGMLRLYSDKDIARLRLIRHFVENMRLNLAGVELALDLVERLRDVHNKVLYVREFRLIGSSFPNALDDLLEALTTHLASFPRTEEQLTKR